MKEFFLAIDLGTSLVKALLVDADGEVAASGSASCPLHEPGPLREEQDPEEVWSAMVKAVRSLDVDLRRSRIEAMAFSSAMHGFMALDSGGSPLTRMWTWADGRSGPQAARLKESMGEAIRQETGCPAAALYYPARLAWLRENDPATFKSAGVFLSIKDFIFKRLTGETVMDLSHASSNGLIDVSRLDFDAAALDFAGMGPERLPRLVHPDETAGTLLPGPAEELGLAPGVPAAPGAGDGGLANLGAGAVFAGQAAATIGTSGAARKVFQNPWIDPAGRAWLYYLGSGLWYGGGAINSGGIVLRWLRDGLLSDVRDRALAEGREPYEAIIELASRCPPGAEGLVFLPYIFGERTPYWNPEAKGVLFGLSPLHGKAHLARAALEGICMSLAHALEPLTESPGGVEEVRATGGFARSDFWLQLLGNVMGRKISTPATGEGSAMGAAFMAMKASGRLKDLSDAASLAKTARSFEPDGEIAAMYGERLCLFKNLYERVEADFKRVK